jgi:hypothetical protein
MTLPWYWWYHHFTLLDIFLCFPVTRTMKLVVMLFGHNHGIDGYSTGSTQSSTLFSGKEGGIIYSVPNFYRYIVLLRAQPMREPGYNNTDMH